MKTSVLLSRLHDLGIVLRLDGDKLEISGPDSALTPEVRAQIAAREADLISLLREMLGIAGPATSAIQRVTRDQDLPLSFAQQRFWFLCQLDDDSSPYTLKFILRMSGALHVDSLEWGLAEIVRRHEALRTTFALSGGHPVQCVNEPGNFELSVADLSGHDDSEAAALEYAQRDVERPFDLENGPLFRATLLRVRPDQHLLVVAFHHIVTDGLSLGVLFHELTLLYAARLQGQPSPLAPLPVQYADYAYWQRQWYERESAALLSFWRKQLDGVSTLDLPTDRPRPARQTFCGAARRFQIPADVVQELRVLGRKEGGTTFMILLSAFNLLLARYSGQTDIAVGTPVANRGRPELESMMGLFLNTLVLRTDLSGEPSFCELLRRVRDVSLEAQRHQEMPFEQLVVELRPDRDLSRNPLFQVLFNLFNQAAPPHLGDIEIEPIERDAVSSMFDLSLWVGDTPDGLKGTIEYNVDLFDESSIDRMVEHLQLLLRAIVADPDRCIWDLPLLTGAERDLLLVDKNSTAREFPRDRCLHELCEQRVAAQPDAVAVQCGDEQLTYAELNARANQLAHHLRDLGAGPDQLVGISVSRSISMLVGLLGIMKSGAAYVPLDPAYPNDRLEFILRDAGIDLLVTEESLRTELPEKLPHIVALDADAEAIAAQSTTNPESCSGAESLAYVIFTSGSTGRPKGVQIEHRALVNFLTSMAERPGVGPDDVLVAVTTISFDIAGLELYLPLLVGAQVVIAAGGEESDAQRLAALLASSSATVMQATPATWHMLLESGWAGCDRLKALCGGEALPRELAEQLLPKCGELWNMYGPTETTIWSLVHEVTSGTGQVPIGEPIANTQIYLLDTHGQPVPMGVPGELFLGGAGLARGYWSRPELTAEKFIEHPFSLEDDARLYNTGDLARYLADGSIEFLGRTDHQVKVRGFRIELGEIECVLSVQDAVAECAVVAQSMRSGEKQLAAHVVLAAGVTATAAELRAALREKLPDYMVPGAFVTWDALPLTPNGKIDRAALMRSEGPRLESGAGQRPPRTESERRIAAIWMDVLEVEQVGRNDNFFDLGGHSLLILQLRHRLLDELGVELSIAEVFQYPTVAAMAAFVSGEAEATAFDEVEQRVQKRRSQAKGDAIAIVGLAGRFPSARNIAELWENLRNGVESVSHFTDDELRASGVPDEVLADPSYVKVRAILADVEMFDAAFFGVPAREAEAMDPQHRAFLESSYEALEDAGYDPLACPGAVSVYAGSLPNSYVQHNINLSPEFLASADPFQVFLDNYGGGFLATRVAYKLNLKGRAVEVQTACSTSLVAVVHACEALVGYQCDMALAGGVSIAVPQKVGYLYQEGLILSPDGHCRPFDANAKGTLGGEGVGVVVLKRLRDALADGDHIRAVIRGAATNNDGSNKVGFTAPSVEGQSEVVFSALADADVDASTISYVEAHGTATPLGDPIEIAALTRAYRAHTEKAQYCAIGSIKSNFGHTDAAAGVAGLIKTVLALEHREIPPSLNFEQPNPEIDFEHSPFFVNTELRSWEPAAGVRRAGVSSFGLGGTNAHVVLEEAPAATGVAVARSQHLLTLSAKSEHALDTLAANVAAHLQAHPAESLADVAFTTQVSRSGLPVRRAYLCSDVHDALEALEASAGHRVSVGERQSDEVRVVFMFPGQGAQHVHMGRELYDSEKTFRAHVDECAELLEPQLGLDLRDVLYPADGGAEAAAEQLQQTRLTQPAVFVIEYALARQWMEWGVRPEAMIGHSIGEYVAATLAGVFSLADALALVAARGRMMQEMPAGDMLSVPLPEDEVRPLLDDDLQLAAVNGPASCVVSGPASAVCRLQEQLAAREMPCRLLHTSHAFHSAMMDGIVEPFGALVENAGPAPAEVRCLSTVTGTWIEPEEWADAGYWGRNLRQPVRFADGAKALLDEPGLALLEVGPGQTLTALVKQQGDLARGRTVTASLRHPQRDDSDLSCVLTALGRLWIAGAPVDWLAFHGERRRRRVALPTYPFERERYWVEPPSGARPTTTARVATVHSDVADWFYVPLWKQTVADGPVVEQVADGCRLVFVDDSGLAADLVAALPSDVEIVEVRAAGAYRAVAARSFEIRPGMRDDYAAMMRALRTSGRVPRHVLHLWNVVTRKDSAPDLAAIDAGVDRAFYGLLFIAQTLDEAFAGEAIRIDVVANDLHAVAADEAFRPDRAVAVGLCRVIPQDCANLSARLIDVPSWDAGASPPDRTVRQIVAECSRQVTAPVVAYRGVHRWVPTYERVRLEAESAPALRDGGVYLITGGLGGIGLAFSEYLAEKHRAKLVLTGRSGLPEREEWSAWLTEHADDDRTSARIRKVQELEARGAEVMAVRGDVTDPDQMHEVVESALQRFGVIHGVIHAAGLATGGIIPARTRERAAEVIDPKVKGTLVLHNLLAEQDLDFFALCSSVSSMLGGIGAADYCGANNFLDALTHSDDLGASTPFISINWDAWSEVGMAADTELHGEMAAQRQAELRLGIPTVEGVDAFARVLAARHRQVVVCPRDIEARLGLIVGADEESSAAGGDAQQQGAEVEQMGRHERPRLSTDYVEPESELERSLAEISQELLGVERIGVNDNLFELGFDSLLAHRMVARLKGQLELSVSVRVVLESPRVSDLARYIQLAQWASSTKRSKQGE